MFTDFAFPFSYRFNIHAVYLPFDARGNAQLDAVPPERGLRARLGDPQGEGHLAVLPGDVEVGHPAVEI